MTKIIAFSGKKQSGKSTSANFIYGLFLSDYELFDSVAITDKGLIEVKKNNSSEYLVIDITKYYHNIGEIDTDIKNLIDQLNARIKIYSFADILKKDICMDIFGMTYEQCYGSDEEKNQITDLIYNGQNITGREAMQIIGTDMFRSLKTNVWPECLMRRIYNDSPDVAIINDCRFPNEVDILRNSGGKVVRLTRHLPDISSEHISEKILDKSNYDWNNFDHILDNESMTIEQQCEALYQILLQETEPKA